MPPAIPRQSLVRSKLEAMLLEFLQAYPDCKEAVSVSVHRIDAGFENGANWRLDIYNPGRALPEHCDKALAIIIPIVQHHFDLAPDS
jgi:hypothetical protein